MKYWTLKIGIADSWIADGFDFDDDQLERIRENIIDYAYDNEVSIQVLTSPNKKEINDLQSGKADPND